MRFFSGLIKAELEGQTIQVVKCTQWRLHSHSVQSNSSQKSLDLGVQPLSVAKLEEVLGECLKAQLAAHQGTAHSPIAVGREETAILYLALLPDLLSSTFITSSIYNTEFFTEGNACLIIGDRNQRKLKGWLQGFWFCGSWWLVVAWLPCLNGDTTGSSSHPGFISQQLYILPYAAYHQACSIYT